MARPTHKTWMSWLPVALLLMAGCVPQQYRKPAVKDSLSAVPAEREAAHPPVPAAAAGAVPLQISHDQSLTPRVARMQLDEPAAPPNSRVAAVRPVNLAPGEADLAPPSQNSPFPSVRIAARVNSQPIFCSELEAAAMPSLLELRHLPEPQAAAKRREVLEKILEKMIEEEVVVQDALRKLEGNEKMLDKLKELARKEYQGWLQRTLEKTGLSKEQFEHEMQRAGLTLAARQKQIERNFLVMEYMRSRVAPYLDKIGREELREYYDQHPEEFQTEDKVDWEDIFIAVGEQHPTLPQAQQFAAALLQQLQTGQAAFADLMQYDEGVSRFRKGKGTGQRRGEIKPPELEPYLFRMQAGQVGPLVPLSTGVHLFRVVERQYAGVEPFHEDAQARIRRKLKNEVAQREWQRMLRQLTRAAVIEIDPAALR